MKKIALFVVGLVCAWLVSGCGGGGVSLPTVFLVTPQESYLSFNQTQQFGSFPAGIYSTGQIGWVVEETGGGSISTSGLYTAPAVAGTYHVTGTLKTDPTIYSTATIYVQD